MRDLGDYEASGRKTNRDQTRLATESPNPVSDFMRGQYSCVSRVARGARVLAGSTLYNGVTHECQGAQGDPPKKFTRAAQRWRTREELRMIHWLIESDDVSAPYVGALHTLLESVNT